MGFRFQQPDEDEGLGPPPDVFRIRRPAWRLPGGLFRWAVVLAVLIVLYSIASIAKGIYADWLWFGNVEGELGQDYLSVFRLRIVTRIWLFFAGAGVFLLFFGANVAIAVRSAYPSGGDTALLAGGREPAAARRLVLVVGVAAALFIAVIFGSQAAGQWDNILLFMNSEPFGVEDPQFGKDIGFYVFQLPALNFIVGWSLGVAVLTVLVVVGIYASRLVLTAFKTEAPPAARVQISLLLMVVLGLFVWRYWLSRFGLLYSERGAAFGAGWTDVNAQLPVIYVLMVLASLTALMVIVSSFRRGLLFLPVGAAVLWVVAAIIGGMIYPATVQRFQVEPNELAREREFIQRNIEATRAAYGLDQIEVLPEELTPARNFVTAAEIAANPETIQNIRLWDNRPLLTTLNARQSFRPRYDFVDVDVDRYEINGEVRQVMLAARELNQEGLPEDARSWVNRRLQFTHGFGLAMVPVNEVAEEGLPEYFVEGLPPTGEVEVEQPRVYYGEMPEHYVIVNTTEEEFDYQGTGEQVRNTYDGKGGVRMSSFLRRVVYAWEFADANVLISDAISDESRLLYRRNIRDRVSEIAPFLLLDSDPYLVVADGQLYWIQDAYTHTDRYPYSTRSAGLNYVRNSVKVVVNAFDGSVTFYLIDESDPVAQVYQGIYPDLFTPFDRMPESLQAHIRYPIDLFELQASMYTTYHITDPVAFFNKEDIWEMPTEVFIDQKQPLEPYYVTMELPGETGEEFVLILPFLPAAKPIATAWLAARSDDPNYGKLLSFRFPPDADVSGPLQVDNRIDQQPAISEQISLWNTSGSQVIRGNMLMIPIGEGNLFVEPIYLQATEGQIPELKRVVVVNGSSIAMEPTLEDALNVVLGREQATTPVPPATPGAGETPIATPTPLEGETPVATATPGRTPTPASPDDLEALIREANEVFERAQERLQEGDFAGYGEEIERLEEILQQLMEIAESGQ